MSIKISDPLTQLAFTIYENKCVYALLLGSGLSRPAEIPTGWEITLDLVRRIAHAQGVVNQSDWASWYRRETGGAPNYSQIISTLGLTADERRSILHSYIEPTEIDVNEGKKTPTQAHFAIAELVLAGYIKLIITTNFDRLIENALRESGVEPTVVDSVDALRGAEPISHANCYVLKLHGDYKDARILNTDEELASYPPEFDALLDRIFDEYGIVICGWSGAWDPALRAAILRAPNRRYSLYWAARGEPSENVKKLLNHRHARLVQVSDANNFFCSLSGMVQTLASTHRQNPIGVELLVGTVKRYLGRPEYRIRLDELISSEAERLLGQLDDPMFNPHEIWSKEEFNNRVKRYETISEPLVRIAGVMGRWGDDSNTPLMLELVGSIWAHTIKNENGQVKWLDLRSYPAVLIMTSYGLGLTRSARWIDLHDMFTSKLPNAQGESYRVVEELFLSCWRGGRDEIWRSKENFENVSIPLSEHLYQSFSDWGKSFVGIYPDFEMLFERFEILASITYLEIESKKNLENSLNSSSRQMWDWIWMPFGRSMWNSRVRKKVFDEIQSEDSKSTMTKAGFANGDKELLDLIIANYRQVAR